MAAQLAEVSAESMLQMVIDPRFAKLLAAVQDGNSEQRANALFRKDGQKLKEWMNITNAQLPDHTIYGRNSIFDPCFSGDVFGLQVETHGLLNWLGWRRNPYYKRNVQFIPWWRPTGAADGTTGAGSPCADPIGWEWGECSYELCHTSWYHRQGDPLGPHNTQMRCETDQRIRLNGTPINDDFEWQVNGIMNALKMDIEHGAVRGSHLNQFEMNGLETIIRTGYRDNNNNPCPYVDSWLINWGNDDLNGATNGWGNFFDFLHELTGQIEYRASAIGDIGDTDMVLFTSRFMADCLLDAFACYNVCGSTTMADVSEVSMRAQTLAYRQTLNGGPMYDGTRAVGFLRLKSGRRLPIMVDDSFVITRPQSNYCSDVYLLTRRVGSIDVMYGEYLDLTDFANMMRKFNAATGIRAEAGGRFAFKGKEDNWCGVAMVGTSPEIYLAAPWAQARISGVCCARRLQPRTGDPFQPNYLPGGRPMYPASSWGMSCTDVPVAGSTPYTPRGQ